MSAHSGMCVVCDLRARVCVCVCMCALARVCVCISEYVNVAAAAPPSVLTPPLPQLHC